MVRNKNLEEIIFSFSQLLILPNQCNSLFSLFPEIAEESEEDDDSVADSSQTDSALPSRENSTADFSSIGNGGDDDDKWKKRNKKKKSKKNDKLDVYALLGLQHERWMATDAQIKAAYRRAALEHHPDKQHALAGDDEKLKQASEDRFKAIQEAYEILCDLQKRREFDSLDTFDDSLPSEMDATSPEEFFKSFGAAFKRNGRWSINQPSPELGDMDTDMDHVDAFYDFWFSFKSWREFPHPDEEDVESAESREERRWIERYNSKLREKGKKDDFKRIRAFVELANKLDPRIVARKEAQRQERERHKLEREAERLRKIEEERLAAEEEERRKEEEAIAAAEAKKQRQSEKKALQKERSRLRKLCGITVGETQPVLTSIEEDDVELLCANLDLVTLNGLNEELSATHLSTEQKLTAAIERLDSVKSGQNQEERKKAEAAKAVEAAAALAAKKEAEERLARLKAWDEEEVRLLRKAMDKFPAGTSRRWEQVQAYVRTRTVDEILDMAKHGLKSAKYTAPAQDSVQIAKKRQANTVIKSEATTRDVSFTDVDVNVRAAAEAEAAGEGAEEAAKVNDTEWSAAEELLLVKALKEVAKDAEDRWDQVAAAVGTKSKVACGRRFKEMKQKFKAKKTGS
jgi:DnaJ family protein C protein 2